MKPLDEVLLIAHFELITNRSITRYEMVDGVPVTQTADLDYMNHPFNRRL